MPTPPSQYKRAFATRLKGIREALQVSQDDFAKALGIKRDAYSKYESGRSVMPPWVMVSLLEMTRHDPWFLLTGRGEPPEVTPEVPGLARIRAAFEHMTPEVREQVVGYAIVRAATTSKAPLARHVQVESKMARSVRKVPRKTVHKAKR